MTDEYNIVQEKLPISQNFKELKEEGLSYIQKISESQWTNLNPSDPGVTILDQVCYALTELGYCNDFPIKDILTGPDKKLRVSDQFYRPENILTTSPITINDYRKYLIDRVKEVDNAIVTPVTGGSSVSSNIYKVYLLIDSKIAKKPDFNSICKTAFFELNKSRNLGELFLMPEYLESLPQYLRGEISIKQESDIKSVISKIQHAINRYIFPDVHQKGYNDMVQAGLNTNVIFNGPKLQNGWIQDESLKPKKDEIQIVDINRLIRKIDGVESSTIVNIENHTGLHTCVSSKNNQILTFEVANSLNESRATKTRLRVRCKGRYLDIAPAVIASILKSPITGSNLPSVDAIKMTPELPEGTFRDIDNYYSIQNTFPEIFAVGTDATNSNATSFDIARSRQLKGYLTLFDQLLANQFSQLANIGKLFSFKVSTTGTPSTKDDFYRLKSVHQKKHLEYPVPYISFSPTYFYQSLYDVPYVRPLLKDNNTFNYSSQILPKNALQEKSWEAYKQDPYNAYIHGLMSIMEDEDLNLTRRNEILDHLLARHGESPLVINTIIDGSSYSGQALMDQVIFKSLLLQNLGWLSYFRSKAYNYIGAYRILVTPEKICCHSCDCRSFDSSLDTSKKSLCKCSEGETKDVTSNQIQKVCGECYNNKTIGFAFDAKGKICCKPYDADTIDFIFDITKVDNVERLKKQYFNNYAAFELKLNLLFGLKAIYINFLNLYSHVYCPSLIKQAIWLIQERKGFITIESNRLIVSSSFEIVIKGCYDDYDQYWKINKPLEYSDTQAIDSWFQQKNIKELYNFLAQPTIDIDDKTYPLIKLNNNLWHKDWFKDHPNKNHFAPYPKYSLAIAPKWANKELSDTKDPIVGNTINLFFPEYIPRMNEPAFKNRTTLFLSNTLPVKIKPKCHYLDMPDLTDLIKAFICWHNVLIYKKNSAPHLTVVVSRDAQISVKAHELATQIIKINGQ